MLTSDPVVVFAPNWLGDAVMALPAIADVRRHFQSARLVVAARASVASLFELVPGIDAVVTLTRRSRDDLATLRSFCTPTPGVGVQFSPPTPGVGTAILLPNSFGVAWLARRVAFRERWGYARDWRRPLLTKAVRVPRESMHQAGYYQRLVAGLGMTNGPLDPLVDVSQTMRARARARLTKEGWDGVQPLVTVAAGAAYGTAKRWLPTHFARVIAELARRGARTVLVGTAGDADTVRMVLTSADARAARPIDLSGRTSLHELAGVIAVSAACVANDSGAMHLAGAIGTPIVALFGPTREFESAPLTRSTGHGDVGRPWRTGAAEVLVHPVWCRPCMLRECPIDHRCMKGLAPARVIASVQAVLG